MSFIRCLRPLARCVFVLATLSNLALASDPHAKTSSAQSYAGTKAGQVRDDNSLKLKLVWCPSGSFTMGSPTCQRDRCSDEGPVNVRLTKGFWLGQHEVTQAEWRRVMRTAPWSGADPATYARWYVKEGDDYPASYVSWDDAQKFCEKLSETERRAGRLPADWKFTLPTEAQWEFACRSGSTSCYAFGDNESDLVGSAWFTKNAEEVGEEYAHAVGQKQANHWGFFDMHGNVWEWCRDRYADQLPGGDDPEVSAGGSLRVIRGGSWSDTSRHCRSAFRVRDLPSLRYNSVGFRVAATLARLTARTSPSESRTSRRLGQASRALLLSPVTVSGAGRTSSSCACYRRISRNSLHRMAISASWNVRDAPGWRPHSTNDWASSSWTDSCSSTRPRQRRAGKTQAASRRNDETAHSLQHLMPHAPF